MSAEVVVVGSVNLDIVVPVTRHPAPGATVLGGDHRRHRGGKGANQAVAAARLGQKVEFVGCVGDDDAGRTLVSGLQDDGVGVDHVRVDPGAPTGLALITVDQEGENAIVVSPGANARLAPLDLEQVTSLLERTDALLLQLEVPLETVERAAALASGTVVLNPAPARALPPKLLRRVDVLVPNRGELAEISGGPTPKGFDEVVAAARGLEGPSAVVVTLGAEGAVVVTADRVEHIPALEVEPVDTTGAGDAFCGALADALVRAEGLSAAARWAAAAAASSVTRAGAQDSLPTRAEVERLLA
jgi:ribokinase